MPGLVERFITAGRLPSEEQLNELLLVSADGGRLPQMRNTGPVVGSPECVLCGQVLCAGLRCVRVYTLYSPHGLRTFPLRP